MKTNKTNKQMKTIKSKIEMKKFKISTAAAIAVYAMLVAVIFCGCNSHPQPENGSSETVNGDYVTKVLDSCEYIEYDCGFVSHRVYSLTHKGNCKFCAERSKK